jgi:ribonucleoside-diphosphate reductase alpha chain
MKVAEPKLSPIAQEITKKRYLKTDLKGKVTETSGEMLWRVAHHAAKAEINWAKNGEVEATTKLFFDKMVNLKFVCSGKAMFEAGNEGGTGQLSACFVLPIEDSISSIFKTLGEAATIHKNNGGTGFNFSRVRMHGDKVRNVPNASSGPVDFLKAFSAALEKILQGAKRNGANMGVLNADHPDIESFIEMKDQDQTIKNFNVSVGATNEFMEAVTNKKPWNLINPRNGEVIKKIKADKLFDKIVEHAWNSGDPGMMFLDRMEEDNPTPTLGKLDATNPCGEQPLLPYESCNLSSIVLSNHVKKIKDDYEVDWNELAETVHTAIHFLDNLIEVNTYVLPEIERVVKFGNRKIGLGVMGLAHLFYILKIPFNSKEGVTLSERLAKFIRGEAEKESSRLAKIRGTFPNFDISYFKGSAEKYRNATMLTIAPTGTISLFANCSSGIEPVFSLLTVRRTFYEDKKNNSSKELVIFDPIFENELNKIATDKKWNEQKKKEIIKQIEEQGSLKHIKDIPDEIKKVFVTTHEIEPEFHIKIQSVWQKYFDNAVSKTINFPSNATIEDIKKVYISAWKLGCKGITIYRDGSKQDQVLTTKIKIQDPLPTNASHQAMQAGKIQENSNSKAQISKQISNFKFQISNSSEGSCPDCKSSKIESSGGCLHCSECGWSACKL